ncbi:ninjurin-2-like isoform X3 [Eriocheir sinensis]|uniref:ninjurin-2-like isoform X3 n=1 Tax=Eriocheir sinensis TaxID=95602 RepID=UPI0021CA7987|nr:ninjurin-2-like isoform X3 [Eriocheir sinensis]
MSNRLFTPTYNIEGVTYTSKDGVSLPKAMNSQTDNVGVGKGLDANQYATKKTVAQGMLDVALLTANASQLKYVLSVGEEHEFYTVMLVLIISSLVLQALAVIMVGLLTAFNINVDKQQRPSEVINHVVLTLSMLTMAVDAIKMGFNSGMVVRKNSTTLIP